MRRIYPDPVRPKPTRLEASTRFWCGAILGLVVGLILAFKLFDYSLAGLIITVVLSVAVCSMLSVHYGDDFWEALPPWLVRLLLR